MDVAVHDLEFHSYPWVLCATDALTGLSLWSGTCRRLCVVAIALRFRSWPPNGESSRTRATSSVGRRSRSCTTPETSQLCWRTVVWSRCAMAAFLKLGTCPGTSRPSRRSWTASFPIQTSLVSTAIASSLLLSSPFQPVTKPIHRHP